MCALLYCSNRKSDTDISDEFLAENTLGAEIFDL